MRVGVLEGLNETRQYNLITTEFFSGLKLHSHNSINDPLSSIERGVFVLLLKSTYTYSNPRLFQVE